MQAGLTERVQAAGLDERRAAVVLRTAWKEFPEIVRDTGGRSDLDVTWLIHGLVDAYIRYVKEGKVAGKHAVEAVNAAARGEQPSPPTSSPSKNPDSHAPNHRSPKRRTTPARAPKDETAPRETLEGSRMVGLTEAHWGLLQLVDGQGVNTRTAARRLDVEPSAATKMLDAARRSYQNKK